MSQIRQLCEACEAGDVDSVQKIISSGVDVNEFYEQRTPLYAAAFNGHAAVVEILLKAGADINKESVSKRDKLETTPLGAAALNGHAAVVEILLKAGADVNKEPDGKKEGMTPLSAAALIGHAAMVEMLLKAGADVNKVSNYQGEEWTALYVAAETGRTAVVEILLKAGADVNKEFKHEGDDFTPLHSAALMGYHDVIAVLLSFNADSAIRDKSQRTAVEILVDEYQQNISEVFTKKAARSVTKLSMQLQKTVPVAELKLLVAEKRASIAEERAVTAEKRATVAEEKATVAEEIASVAAKAVSDAEERAAAAEERALHAEEARMASESRAILCKERALSAERRAASAEETATAAGLRAIAAEKKAITAEERAITAEKRASVAEERAQLADMEIISAKKKATDANSRLLVMEERVKQAEDTVKTLQEYVRVSDGKIAGLVQMNTTLESRATTAEQQISELTTQCRLLQEELNKAKVPSWVVQKEDIVFTDKEIDRGAYGVAKAAEFHGLDVVAKFLHKDATSLYYEQQFKREMDLSAQIRHPNIVLFIGATVDEEYIILTELMHTSLRAVLEGNQIKGSTMTQQQVSSIATDVGKALNYLHMWKPDAIIHRDVSSSNVLLESLGADMWKAKVSDFGSSNFARQVRTVAPGCPAYAAPECGNPKMQSPKMDVFSYGVLLLEISCTQFPDEQNREALISTLSWSTMKALIKDCTAEEPQLRPTMTTVLKRLTSI